MIDRDKPQHEWHERLDMAQVETLQEIASKLEKRAGLFGLELDFFMSAHSTDGMFVAEAGRRVVSAASINKLAVSLFARKHDPDEQIVVTPGEIKPGAGRLDMKLEQDEVVNVGYLVADMLEHSGNTAFVRLVKRLGGVDHVNAQLAQTAYLNTKLRGVQGKVYTGETSARDAALMMKELVTATGKDCSGVVGDSLRASKSKSAFRTSATSDERIQLWNKIGRLNKDDRSVIKAAEKRPGGLAAQPDVAQQFLRHDVGLVQGTHGEQLAYAFLLRADTKLQAYFADQLLGVLGANIAETLGGHPTRRLLGTLATLNA